MFVMIFLKKIRIDFISTKSINEKQIYRIKLLEEAADSF